MRPSLPRHRAAAAPISSSCWHAVWKGRATSRARRAALERATRLDARSSEIWAELGAFHLRRSQPEDAEAAAKSALAIDGTSIEGHRVLGLVYAGYVDGGSQQRGVTAAQTAQFLKDAITHLELASTSTLSGDLVLNFTLGRLYLRAATPEKAVQSLTRVVAQNPGSVQARLLLAQAYAVSKDLPAAIATLEAIVDDEPRVAAALGQYQEQAGAAARGRRQLHQSARGPADEPRAEVASDHRALQRQGLHGRGGVCRRRAPAAPGGRTFPAAAGRALFDAGDRAGGVAVLEAAAKAFPKDTPTLYRAGRHLSGRGPRRRCRAALRQVLVLEPTNPNALNYLGYLLAMRGDKLDEAVQLVRKALEAEPDNGAYLDSLGWAHFQRGDLAEAEKYLVPAAQRMPSNSEVQDHLGDVFAEPWPRGRRHRRLDARRSTATARTSIVAADPPEDRRRPHQDAAVRLSDDQACDALVDIAPQPAGASLAARLSGAASALSSARRGSLTLPQDAGAPIADAAAVHAQVSSTCRGVRTFTAELGAFGRAGDTRVGGRVIAGFERPARCGSRAWLHSARRRSSWRRAAGRRDAAPAARRARRPRIRTRATSWAR